MDTHYSQLYSLIKHYDIAHTFNKIVNKNCQGNYVIYRGVEEEDVYLPTVTQDRL